jgi:hypothetical protein
MISHAQFTYSSVSIHFVLVGAPLFLQYSLVFFLTYSTRLSTSEKHKRICEERRERVTSGQNSTVAGQRSSGAATPAEARRLHEYGIHGLPQVWIGESSGVQRPCLMGLSLFPASIPEV